MRRSRSLLLALLAAATAPPARAADETARPRSQPISAVLREPLPPETLALSERAGQIIISGPTFTYTVDPATGAVTALEARREGQVVVRLEGPARLVVGRFDTAGKENVGQTTVSSRDPERIVLKTSGTLRHGVGTGAEGRLPYELVSTFFNDGVVVGEFTLRPREDLAVDEVFHEVRATGAFRHYLHKRRDENGFDSPWGALPRPGDPVKFSDPTSCLQVFSPRAGLAIFTDGGAARAADGADTAAVRVASREGDAATVSLTQHVVHQRPADGGFRLEADQPFRFRVGLSVVPNRLPHRRRHDLRMFAWIGDDKHPYPTDREILDVARLGYTLFQMHRLGPPGEPRPPAEELDRVIRSVHEAGMLFIWTANADLLYAHAGSVRKMRESGKWPLWQGFNYGGRYTDGMDRFCDLVATCLAAPNGLADDRIASGSRMLDRYAVDGMYIDDNLAYANCPLWREHGHPQSVYDSLIELHEMNWRRRQLLRARRPHAVLIDHCAKATVLPVICDFDAHLHGEGYTFASAEDYWAQYGAFENMYAQGCIWPGGKEGVRSATGAAFNLDLLTGGGKYMYIDWRLYPEKFPYSAGVGKDEPLFVRAYNLAQYGFGMYESTPFHAFESADLFSTSAPGTHATIYRNDVWRDHLIVMANMNAEAVETGLVFRSPERLGLGPDGTHALLEVNAGTCRRVTGRELLDRGISGVRLPGQGLELFHLRRLPADGPCHLWGGKRLSEDWDAGSGKLVVELQGPPGAEVLVVFARGPRPVGAVRVDGGPGRFLVDTPQRLVHGTVRFGTGPVRVEVSTSSTDRDEPPEGPVPRGAVPAR